MNTEQIQEAISDGVAAALIEVRKDDETKMRLMVQLVQLFKDHLTESHQKIGAIHKELEALLEEKIELERLVYQYKAELKNARGIDSTNQHSDE